MTDRELRSRVRAALDQTMPPLPDDPALVEAVLQRHEKKRWQSRARMGALRACIAMAVIALVVCGGAIVPRQPRTYLDVYQSEDGEQYVMRGVSVTPSIGQTAGAAPNSTQVTVFYTEDWDEVVSALNEVPLMPVWLPEGWAVTGYDVIIDPTQKHLSVYYEKPVPGEDSDVMIYHAQTVSDLRYFSMAIEANNDGRYVELDNGLSVYVDMNVRRPTSMWQDGLTGYSLSGDITEEELLRIIRAMYGLD